MTTHAMIDLETLDVLPTAVVLTIGGVKFDPNSIKETTQHFYYRFNVDEQLSKGRTTSKSTLDWWATQEQSVVDEALGDHDRTPVLSVLKKLNKCCVGVDTIWCQGPAFDIVILEDMFRQYDHAYPFWKIKTVEHCSHYVRRSRKEIKFEAHNALEDCKVQALCVQQTVNKLGLNPR